jgi:predicted AlkP superfamily phosphohydrolase/phosphomutase
VKSGAVALAVAIVALSGCDGRAGRRASAGVLVFGIDGGTWKVMDELAAAGELPNLARLRERGVYGVLRSRHPMFSPVVWTTIMTGRLPDEHGLEDWSTSQSQHRRVKAVWDIASDHDVVANVFNVPGTWPPVPIRGVMFSGFPFSDSTAGGITGVVVADSKLDASETCHRENAAAIVARMDELRVGEWSQYFELRLSAEPAWRGMMRVKRLSAQSFYLSPCYRTDEGLVISSPASARKEIEETIGQRYIPEGPGWYRYDEPDTPGYLYEHLLQVADVQTRVAAFHATRPWRLFIYVDTLVDRVSHPYWPYMWPRAYDGLDPERATKYQEVVRDAYRASDRHLGEVLSKAPDDPYVIVISDHGFRSNSDRTTRTGSHDLEGVYLVAGPGLAAAQGGVQSIENVAPTILYLMGLAVPRDMKGKVIYRVAKQLGDDVEYVATYETEARDAAAEPVDDKTWEQLRGLGYVD